MYVCVCVCACAFACVYVYVYDPFSKPWGLKRALSEDMVALKVGKAAALKARPGVERLRLGRAGALKAGGSHGACQCGASRLRPAGATALKVCVPVAPRARLRCA